MAKTILFEFLCYIVAWHKFLLLKNIEVPIPNKRNINIQWELFPSSQIWVSKMENIWVNFLPAKVLITLFSKCVAIRILKTNPLKEFSKERKTGKKENSTI